MDLDAIVLDQDFIKEALLSANIPALIMSIVHMTGDTRILEGDIKPRFVDPVSAGSAASATEDMGEDGFTLREMEVVRGWALEAIDQYRAAKEAPPELHKKDIESMLSYMCGQKLSEEYRDFIEEEIGLDGIDRRGIHLETPELMSRAESFSVIIIGAGMGGILASIRLQEAGIAHTLIEKNPGVGGTWHENRYPGCRVDVPGHSYSYSFEPNYDWQHHYPVSEDIRTYYERCAEKYGVNKFIRLNTEVVKAVFDEEALLWRVHIVGKDGVEEVLSANAVISAVGQLNRPRFPAIDGLDDFQGELVHSAMWPSELDCTGKRVAVIGSGASAFQIVPEMSRIAKHLTVFQRSPVWMFPNPVYHTEIPEGHKWALRNIPFYAKWYRFRLFYSAVEGVYEQTLVDPDWNSSLSVSASNDVMRENLTMWIKSQVSDQVLLEKVLPKYPPFGKRILQDNGDYLSSLQKDNVELVAKGVNKLVSNGVVSGGANVHEVDLVICATGFFAERFLYPINIIGRGGVTLADQWGVDEGRAYLGITVPNFPNLFCVYGPNTNLVVAGSIAHNAESQVNYIMRSIKLLLERNQAAMDCRGEVYDNYNAKVDSINARTAWGTPSVNSWYKNSSGRVTSCLPFRIIDYWKMTKNPDPEDYLFINHNK